MRAAKALAALVLAAAAADRAAAQATIEIVVADAPGAGFLDATPASPVGGNSGTTLGEQRLLAFREATRIWGAKLPAAVHLRIQASFSATLPCTPDWAVFATAGSAEQVRDFAGAPRAATWYPVALANAIAGRDLSPSRDDVVATFSSALDGGPCGWTSPWYYGLDAKGPWEQIDFVTIAAHELAHGLGFQSTVDPSSGARLLGRDDVFSAHLADGPSGRTWSEMSDAERAASARSQGNLVFRGDAAKNAARGLTRSITASGDPKLYAPATVEPGSSVSHLDATFGTSDVMVPYYVDVTRGADVSSAILRDLGWPLTANAAGPVAAAAPAALFVPSAARAAGAGGAFYTTNLVVANRGAVSVSYRVEFLGHDADGRNAASKTFALAPGMSVTYADVLGSVFGLDAAWGAIRVVPDASGLVVTAETGTPSASGGRFGQSVPASGGDALATASSPRAILGVNENASDRTNLALVNATDVPATVTLTLVAKDGHLLGTWSADFKPLEMRQLSRVARVLGATGDVDGARLEVATTTSGAAFAAYASVIDNVTNDPRTRTVN